MIVPDGECLRWKGAKTVGGYGVFWDGAKQVLAHRFAYGKVPSDLTIDHLCNNRACVNVAHMQVVTRGENTRLGKARRLVCLRGHPYAEFAGFQGPGKKWRYCRKCRNERRHPA